MIVKKQPIVISIWIASMLVGILMVAQERLTLEILAKDVGSTWPSSPLFVSEREQAVPWYGITRAPVNDWPTIRENLGGAVVDLIAYPDTPLNDIIVALDSAGTLEYRVVFHIYDGNTNTNKPWYLDANGHWVFPQSAIDMLEAVSDHPAVLAVYALHEPLDEGEAYVSVDHQRELYRLLKEYTSELPVYTDMGGVSVWEDRGVDLTDGLCDYCRTGPSSFRDDWTSEECLTETLSRINAEMDTQQRLMPNSQLVLAINTYEFTDYNSPIRLPTPYELGVVRDYLCELSQPMLYHPWHYSGYDATLEDAAELWPVITQGCARPLKKTVNQTEARAGDTLIYTLTVDNGDAVGSAFLITDVLDADTNFVSFVGEPAGSYGHTANVITWTGTVAGMSRIQMVFQATISADASGRITNSARFRDGMGSVYTDTAGTLIVKPELTAIKQVEPNSIVLAGTTLTYVIAMLNRGDAAARVSMTDSVPLQTIYIDGSAQVLPSPPAQELPQYVKDSVIWSGDIAAGTGVTVAFQVRIRPDTEGGTVIGNVAWVDELSDPLPAVAYQAPEVVVDYGCYLPIVLSAGDRSL